MSREVHAGAVITTGDATVIHCDTCGFAHLLQLPDAADAVAFHSDGFFDEVKPAYRAAHERDREWWNLVHAMRLSRIERAIGGVGRLLDVGSGYGDLVARASKRGWDAKGLEPSESAAQWANNHGRVTYAASMSRAETQNLGSFDAIVFDQSLEHIVNPGQAIANSRELLVEGGALCINFANDFSAVQEAASLHTQESEWWVVPSEHVNYFDLTSIETLLEANEFTVVDVTGSFPIDWFLGMGLDYLSDNELGRKVHEQRMRLEFAFRDAGRLQDLERAYQGLGRAGFGRQIEVIAVYARRGDGTLA